MEDWPFVDSWVTYWVVDGRLPDRAVPPSVFVLHEVVLSQARGTVACRRCLHSDGNYKGLDWNQARTPISGALVTSGPYY